MCYPTNYPLIYLFFCFQSSYSSSPRASKWALHPFFPRLGAIIECTCLLLVNTKKKNNFNNKTNQNKKQLNHFGETPKQVSVGCGSTSMAWSSPIAMLKRQGYQEANKDGRSTCFGASPKQADCFCVLVVVVVGKTNNPQSDIDVD